MENKLDGPRRTRMPLAKVHSCHFSHPETVTEAGEHGLISIVHKCTVMYVNVHHYISPFPQLSYVSTKPFLKVTMRVQLVGDLDERLSEYRRWNRLFNS